MRLRTSWVISALGALWLASCGSNNDAALFSSIPDSGGANQTAGAAGKSGSNGGASSGGAASGGAASGGASSGGVNNNAGSENGGTSNNAGSENGGTSNNAGSENGGAGGSIVAGNGGTGGSTVAGNGGAGGSIVAGNGGTGGSIVAGNGGSGGGAMKPCDSNDSCDVDEYCHKNACAAATGTCQRRSQICPSIAPNIVCGCDGYTYLTPCLAAWNGVNLDYEGVCSEELLHHHCTDVNDCPDPQPKGAACVDFENSCGNERDPECWVLPEQCPENDPGRLQVCGIGPAVCVGVCAAAKSGEPFAWDNTCN